MNLKVHEAETLVTGSEGGPDRNALLGLSSFIEASACHFTLVFAKKSANFAIWQVREGERACEMERARALLF